MAKKQEESQPIRSDAEFGQMIGQVAKALCVDAVLCATETASLPRHTYEAVGDVSLVAATPNGDTYDTLAKDGFGVLRLSVRVADKYRQARHTIAVALSAGKVSAGEFIVCAVGQEVCGGGGDLILVTDVVATAADVALSELIKLTNGIRPSVLEAALEVACKIGRVSRTGKRVGTIFVLGDSNAVAAQSKQLILNPFQGHEHADRQLTDPDIYDMLVEFAKLDGAFIIRGDGFIRTAGAYLAIPEAGVKVPAGLGARHTAAAAITAQTHATAVVVSSTDGYVRAFSGGKLVLQIDPDVPFAPIA
jgi:DNA integrity scanning protein DisA with diadenylate cyclase activity